MVSSLLMLFPTYIKKKICVQKKLWGGGYILGIKNKSKKKTIVDRDFFSISNIYKIKIVVLASEPVDGRSQVTELPC